MTDSQDSTALMVQVTISAVIFIMNILGNSLILLVVKYSKYFSHVTCHLVAHVAVADIIFGCCVVLRMFFETGLLRWTSDSCIIIGQSLVMATSACSGFGICLILVENYLSVRHLNSNGDTSMTLQSSDQYCKLLDSGVHPAAASCLRHQPARSATFQQPLSNSWTFSVNYSDDCDNINPHNHVVLDDTYNADCPQQPEESLPRWEFSSWSTQAAQYEDESQACHTVHHHFCGIYYKLGSSHCFCRCGHYLSTLCSFRNS